MSACTLDKVISWLKELRLSRPEEDFNMSLHGGEPMLYDLDKVLYLLKGTEQLNLKWCLTTNLIYEITDKHLEIFRKMVPFEESLILTSYDFGDLRFREGEEELWRKNVSLLQKNGIQVQPIICVTNYVVENVTTDKFFSFLKENNLKRFNLERITETGRAVENKIKPKNRAQNEWLLEIYKKYKETDLFCPLFYGVEQSLYGSFIGCRARKCMQNVITINPNGTIAGCPNTADKTYGNLDSIDECKKCSLIKEETSKKLECLVCPYYKYCNGDCFQLKFDDTGCSGMKPIYKYLIEGR